MFNCRFCNNVMDYNTVDMYYCKHCPNMVDLYSVENGKYNRISFLAEVNSR